MLKIFTYSLGSLETNCYIVASGNECIVIDPADAPEFISEEIQRKNLKPKTIVLTHGHFDHVLGACGLKLAFEIQILADKKDEFLLANARYSAQKWLGRKIDEPNIKIDKYLKDKDKIKIGEDFLEIIETPGHSPGSVCLYSKENKIIFTGDLLFKNGVGRTDFSYSDNKSMEKSLKNIFRLPAETIVYPGHGEKTTIGDEKKYTGQV